MSCRRSSRFWGLGCPKILHEIEDSLAPERWGALRFTFAPAMQRLDLYCNVPQVWLALDREETPPESSRQEVPVTWLVWRQELDPRWRSLDVDVDVDVDVDWAR